ncbi:MAG: hypothetical protein ACI39G_02170 [Pseudoramibacter sp.]
MANQVMRYQIADYIDTSGVSGTETYALMGTGFTKADEDPGTKTKSKTYINESSATTKVDSYETKFKYESDLIKDSEAGMFLYNITRDRKTGEDAQTNYVRVDLFAPVTSTADNTSFKARKFVVSVVGDATEGDGGEGVTFSGDLEGVGDPVLGTFDVKTKTFTATTTTTSSGK